LIARLILALLAALPLAAVVRLYLKDGTYHVAREYEVKEDRVKFYSTERGDWEEIPLDLVDLKKTKAESDEREQEKKQTLEAERLERKAEREMEREIASVPAEAGPYWIGGKMKPLVQAESKVAGNKKRSIFKAMSPIPVVSGKATLEVDGAAAKLAIGEARPEFYFRLSKEERFGIVKMGAHNGNRVVERWTIVPVTKEVVQERDEVPNFRHQVGDDLYKLWPQKPMAPGEYAIIQFSDGKVNTQVWDFSIAAGAR
jgi:hypothetical protein